MTVSKPHDLADPLEQPVGFSQTVRLDQGNDPAQIEDDVFEPDLQRMMDSDEQMLFRMGRDLLHRGQQPVQLQVTHIAELILAERLFRHPRFLRQGADPTYTTFPAYVQYC